MKTIVLRKISPLGNHKHVPFVASPVFRKGWYEDDADFPGDEMERWYWVRGATKVCGKSSGGGAEWSFMGNTMLSPQFQSALEDACVCTCRGSGPSTNIRA
jgi:hypothetical protein